METATVPANALKMRVEGMDCGACAIKVENALKRLPGVSDINMNYSTETLSVRLDENRTSLEVVENKIRALGYTPKLLSDAVRRAAEATVDEQTAGNRPWWKARNGQTVIGLGALLAAAFLVSAVKPDLSLWVYGAAALVGLVPVARRAITGAISGTPFSIETLMTVATAGAVAIGATEEATVVIFLFAVGELLETVAAGHARAGIKALINLVPRTARIEEAGQIREVTAERLRVGDVAMVRPGDRVPSDGEVIEGRSEIDEAPVTGESVPVAKGVGDQVYAGSINANGMLRVRLTRTAADNTIARIVHLVEEAQGSKAPTARFIGRFSAYCTPAAMVVAALVLLAKRPVGVMALRDQPREDAIEGISRLKDLGIRTLMLTGDNRRTGDVIGLALGLEVQSELLPDAKLAIINDLKQSGPVAVIGDGINDAPALAAANVGVAMGSGTDVALETADAALLKNRVVGVAELVALSRATLANIWQNITIALGLKAVFLATTVFGVTANALRLLRWR